MSLIDILYLCTIYFRPIAQILRKLELPQTFFKKFEIPSNLRLDINLLKNCHDWKGVTASLLYQISSGLKIRKSRTYACTHIYTSGHQLKIIFLNVLEHSEYSDSKISICFSRKQSFLSKKAKCRKIKSQCGFCAKNILTYVEKFPTLSYY